MFKNQLCFILIVAGIFFGIQTVWAIPYISINHSVANTTSRHVTLYLQGPDKVLSMMVSNEPDFSGADWETFKSEKDWYLKYGNGAVRTVFVKFKDVWGVETQSYAATITLNVPTKMTIDFTIDKGGKETGSRNVSLDFIHSLGVESFRVSNSKDFTGSDSIQINDGIMWTLTSGTGNKTVYVQFTDAKGSSAVISKTIHYTQPDRYLTEGTLLKGQGGTVYYLGYDGGIHAFLSAPVYLSWFKDFSGITYVSNAKLSQYHVGQPVCVRPGTWLVKFKGFPKVYSVEPGCIIRPIRSEAEAYILYGSSWNKRVMDLDSTQESIYKIRGYSVADASKDIVDQDNDGVSKEIEDQYGTSDTNADTDGDGLTDYEEINYWYSDPLNPDTDHNGIKDGAEVLRGYFPTGSGKITAIPSGTYDYSLGSIVKRKSDGKYYYHRRDGQYCLVGSSTGDKGFTANNFPVSFVISSSWDVTLSPISNCRVNGVYNDIALPTNSTNGVVSLM